MSRQCSDAVDTLAVRERSLVEEGVAWTLHYLLWRITTGTAEAFAIRAHACNERDGAQHVAVAGLPFADAPAALALFHRVAEGCVFPVHLQDVVHDAADELAPRRSVIAMPAN